MTRVYLSTSTILAFIVSGAFADMVSPTVDPGRRNGGADTYSHEYADGDLAARVTFTRWDTNLNQLLVTLENISTADVRAPEQLLTGVFFSINGIELMPVSAVPAPGSFVAFGSSADHDPDHDGLDSHGEVGGEFGFTNTIDPRFVIPLGATNLISSAGIGAVGPFHLFPGENIDDPLSPDGMNYGILSAGDDLKTGNAAVTGAEPLIRNAVVFTFDGLGFDTFTLADTVSAISFRYGTSELPVVPIPSAVFLGLFGLSSVGFAKRWLR